MTSANCFNMKKFKEVISKQDGGPRACLNQLAKMAEQAERYEDMCLFMGELVNNHLDTPLVVDERNLLSVAYKNVIGSRRASWRTLNLDEKKDEPLTAEYRRQVEAEMTSVCKEVLSILEK
eukprot:g81608.t1